MYFMQADAFYRCQIHVIINRAFSCIKRGDGIHLFFRKRKIKDVEVLYHPFLAYRLGNDHHIALVQPAEDNLTDRATVLFSDGFQHGIVPDVVLPFGKRCPCFVLYAFALQELVGGFLPHCAGKGLAGVH